MTYIWLQALLHWYSNSSSLSLKVTSRNAPLSTNSANLPMYSASYYSMKLHYSHVRSFIFHLPIVWWIPYLALPTIIYTKLRYQQSKCQQKPYMHVPLTRLNFSDRNQVIIFIFLNSIQYSALYAPFDQLNCATR